MRQLLKEHEENLARAANALAESANDFTRAFSELGRSFINISSLIRNQVHSLPISEQTYLSKDCDMELVEFDSVIEDIEEIDKNAPSRDQHDSIICVVIKYSLNFECLLVLEELGAIRFINDYEMEVT